MWQISGTVARWSDARCEATVDLRPRQGGLQLTRLFDRPIAWGPVLLGSPSPEATPAAPTTSAITRVEPYVRGTDLIFGYDLDDLGLQACIYWRWLAASNDAASAHSTPWVGFEWIGSFITQRAATSAVVSQATILPTASELLFYRSSSASGAGAFERPTLVAGTSPCEFPAENSLLRMARRGDAEYSYVEMTYPGDLSSVGLTTPSAAAPAHGWELKLALGQLEKGVMRRYRARCLWVPGATDQATALEAWSQFVKSPPPLET